MRKIGFLTVIIIISILTGCMITPKFYQLNPDESYDAYWLKGKRFIGVTQGKIKVVASFDRVENHKTIFYLQILNLGEDAFDVNPADFSCTYDVQLGDQKEVVKAVDPEKKLNYLNKEIEVKEARLQRRKQVDLLFEIWDSASDPFVERSDKDDKLDRIEDENRQIENNVSYISTANEITNLSKVRTTWDTEALRRTTLRKGDAISGLVFFPLSRDATEMVLSLPLNDEIIELKYRQIKE